MATATEPHEGEIVGDETVVTQLESSEALMALNSSEIDSQIATAKKYPRSLKRFVDEAKQMVCLTEEVAGECIYALPRSGKTIEGPSARFAEVIASAWGNCRAGARVISEDNRFVTAQGIFSDLQRNVAITYEVKRRITDKSGRKYKDDMIGVTSNAACSIALRNAVLKGVPKAFWKPIYDAARHTIMGDAKTLSSRRSEMLGYFQKLGAEPEKVFALLGVEGEADISLDHLVSLRGLATAIKDGDTTVEQAFDVNGGKKVGRSCATDDVASMPDGDAPKMQTTSSPSNPDPATAPQTSNVSTDPQAEATPQSVQGSVPSDTSPLPSELQEYADQLTMCETIEQVDAVYAEYVIQPKLGMALSNRATAMRNMRKRQLQTK